jgi:hypothetical protein
MQDLQRQLSSAKDQLLMAEVVTQQVNMPMRLVKLTTTT